METNLNCNVCGEKNFNIKDGYYYCNECGTQLKQMKFIEMDEEVTFTDQKHQARILKIRNQSVKPELTTWECCNYILYGIVEQLIQLGAKEEIKLTTLQLWATYLRSSEVAFFSRHHEKLPKLGINFSENDAKILYNHEMQRKRKRKSRGSSDGFNSRLWAKQKRDLDVSEYENLYPSETSQSSTSTNRGAKLEFANRARKFYKRKMSSTHLKKHEEDDSKILNCHTLKFKTVELPKKVRAEKLDLKTLYTIVYIALNLIDDDIQLSDILRYIKEGHLAYDNMSIFFPDNVLETSLKLLKSIGFNRNLKLTNDCVRRHTMALCNRLNLPNLTIPNILKLVYRYVADLNLPEYMGKYIENLIHLNPPEMKTTHKGDQSRCYEARAMAYIIFTLKLLFGLNGKKEAIISKSSKEINCELKFLGGIQPPLFVMNDWVKYIEMRKIILCQCHTPTSIQFGEVYSDYQNINFLKEISILPEDFKNVNRIKAMNMEQIFETFRMNYTKQIKVQQCEPKKFPPSMTPNLTYFQQILQEQNDDVFIPSFMYDEFSNTDIESFLNPSTLQKKLSLNGIHIAVEKLSTEMIENDCSVFQSFKASDLNTNRYLMKEIDFDITEEEWKDYTKKEKLKNTFLDSNIISPLNNDHSDRRINTNISTDVFESKNESKKLVQPQIDSIDTDKHFYDASGTNGLTNNCYDSQFDFDKYIIMYISNLDYWMFLGRTDQLFLSQIENLKKTLPSTFLWLLDMCAKMIHIEWDLLYHELLTIEVFYIYSFDPPGKCDIVFGKKSDSSVIKNIVKYYKSMW